MTRSTSSRGRGTAFAAALLLVPLGVAAAVYHERIGHWWRWGDPQPLAPDLDRLLSWLPEDTQTLMVVRDAEIQHSKNFGTLGALEVSRRLASASLVGLGKGAHAGELDGRRLTLWMEGSRKFRSPTGLGSMLYEGCQVFVFDGDLGTAGDRLMARAIQETKRPLSLRKHPVAVIEEHMEQDTWTFFLMRISSNALLLATDQRFLEEVLHRRQERSARRALPDDLPEWREIDRAAPFWALRHYDRGDSAEDPSSPFGGEKPANCPDEQAVGLAFTLLRESGASDARPRLVYFSATPEPTRVLGLFWNRSPEGLTSTMQPLRDGVLEVTPALDSRGAVNLCFFVLLLMLGHGVYV